MSGRDRYPYPYPYPYRYPYAIRLGHALAPHGLKWLEEFLPPDDYEGYAEVRRAPAPNPNPTPNPNPDPTPTPNQVRRALRGTGVLCTTGEHEYTRYGSNPKPTPKPNPHPHPHSNPSPNPSPHPSPNPNQVHALRLPPPHRRPCGGYPAAPNPTPSPNPTPTPSPSPSPSPNPRWTSCNRTSPGAEVSRRLGASLRRRPRMTSP